MVHHQPRFPIHCVFGAFSGETLHLLTRFTQNRQTTGASNEKNTVKARLAAGESIVNGWLAIPSSFSAEVVGMAGFDSVTVDLQHGMIGFDAALPMLQALSATPAIPIARVPGNDGPQIMRLLDAGAYGIICPMISTPTMPAVL